MVYNTDTSRLHIDMAGISVVAFGLLAVASRVRCALPLSALTVPNAEDKYELPDSNIARLLQSPKSNLQLLVPMLLQMEASGEGSGSYEEVGRGAESFKKLLSQLTQQQPVAPADDEDSVVLERLLKLLGGKNVSPPVPSPALSVKERLLNGLDDEALSESRVRALLLGKASGEGDPLEKIAGHLAADSAASQMLSVLNGPNQPASSGTTCPFCQLLHQLQVIKLQALLESEVRKATQEGAGGATGGGGVSHDEYHDHDHGKHDSCPVCIHIKHGRRTLSAPPPARGPVPA